MASLTFSNGNALAQSLRAAPSKYNRSKIRYNFETSEGQRVAEVFYPHKALPVQFQDVNTEDYVVITKGKVVSAVGIGEYIQMNEADASGTLPWPNASGQIPVFENRASTTVKANMDTSFWGYNEVVNGLVIPANGGTPRTTAHSYEYTANDATVGTYKSDGSLAVDADDVTGILTSGNLPIGVAMYDIYQDIRGKNLNYQMWDQWSILQDWFCTVPFVREGGGGVTYDTDLTAETTADDSTVATAMRNVTYLTVPSGIVPKTGCAIKADVRGNYMIQGSPNADAFVAGSAFNAAGPTAQTVARLVTLDSRFPKDMLEYVDTYEGSQMAGTDTGGLPYWLFMFAYNYLTATATTTASIFNIVNAVRDGRFGMARFNLHVN